MSFGFSIDHALTSCEVESIARAAERFCRRHKLRDEDPRVEDDAAPVGARAMITAEHAPMIHEKDQKRIRRLWADIKRRTLGRSRVDLYSEHGPDGHWLVGQYTLGRP